MDNKVVYTVTAQDMLSGKLTAMDGKAKMLEGTLGGVNKILGTLGITFAVFKGIEFVKSGIEKVEELHQATAQVEAALTSTNHAAGRSMKELEEQAQSLASNTKFSRADVFGMQSLLLTFTQVKDKIFDEAQPAIMDLAQRMGGDLKGASIQVGKALNDPVQGINALRRVGVSFSKEQREVITRLVETGHAVEAQKMILKELAVEFGGSAKAAFDADPAAKFNKMMGSLKIAVGEGALALLEEMMPALEDIAAMFKALGGFIKDVVHWFKEHELVAEALGRFLKILVVVMTAYWVIQKLIAMWSGIVAIAMASEAFTTAALAAGFAGASTAGSIFAGVMAMVDAALAANPIGLIIIGIAALITLVYEVVQHFYDWGAAITLLMGPIGWLISAIMSIYSHWQSIKDAFNSGGIIGGLKRIGIVLLDTILYPLQQALEFIGKITGADWAKDAAQSLKDLRKNLDLITPEEDKKTEKKKTNLAGVKPKVENNTLVKKEDKTKSVSGPRVVTINISIGNLINDFTIKTTNIQESAGAIHDKIVQALTSAVNDSQIVAGEN